VRRLTPGDGHGLVGRLPGVRGLLGRGGRTGRVPIRERDPPRRQVRLHGSRLRGVGRSRPTGRSGARRGEHLRRGNSTTASLDDADVASWTRRARCSTGRLTVPAPALTWHRSAPGRPGPRPSADRRYSDRRRWKRGPGRGRSPCRIGVFPNDVAGSDGRNTTPRVFPPGGWRPPGSGSRAAVARPSDRVRRRSGGYHPTVGLSAHT